MVHFDFSKKNFCSYFVCIQCRRAYGLGLTGCLLQAVLTLRIDTTMEAPQTVTSQQGHFPKTTRFQYRQSAVIIYLSSP